MSSAANGPLNRRGAVSCTATTPRNCLLLHAVLPLEAICYRRRNSMKRWLIGYLLQSPGLEHADFFDALKNAGATRLMPSHWVLESDKTAMELRDHFVALLAPNDQLLVAELGQEVVWWTKD